MNPLHMSGTCRLLLVVVMLVLAADLLTELPPALELGFPAFPTQCASQVPLVAHSEGTLARHHQWLQTPPHFAGEDLSIWRFSPYIIANSRTGMGFMWSIDEMDRASQQVRFDVLTRWVWFHPGWANDAWILLYDCPPL